MEFSIERDPGMPGIDVIEEAVLEQDPAAMVDLDPTGRTVRLATWIEAPQLGALLARAGWALAPDCIVQHPSVCCGGCGG